MPAVESSLSNTLFWTGTVVFSAVFFGLLDDGSFRALAVPALLFASFVTFVVFGAIALRAAGRRDPPKLSALSKVWVSLFYASLLVMGFALGGGWH